MHDEDSLRLAQDILNDINKNIGILCEILNRSDFEYELDLKRHDYSTIAKKKKYARLDVTIKQNVLRYFIDWEVE